MTVYNTPVIFLRTRSTHAQPTGDRGRGTVDGRPDSL